MILQGSIDRLGNTCIAVQVAARCLAELINIPASALGTAMATYSSQNFGAGKRTCVTQGLKMVLLICSVWWAVAMALTFTMGRSAVELITGSGDPVVLSAAMQYLYINIPMIPPIAVLVTLRSMLQGIRHRISPLLYIPIEMIGKIIFALWIVPVSGYVAVCVCESIPWVVCCASLCVMVFKSHREQNDRYLETQSPFSR